MCWKFPVPCEQLFSSVEIVRVLALLDIRRDFGEKTFVLHVVIVLNEFKVQYHIISHRPITNNYEIVNTCNNGVSF